MSAPTAFPPGDALPRRGGPISRTFGRTWLSLMGWRISGALPDVPRAVVIVAPHTTNWDFIVGIAAKFALGLEVAFLGKDTLFRGAFGRVMRWLGGIPVDRSHPHDVVTQTIAQFTARPKMILGLAPEGTRRAVEKWRTGFYYIARGAGVPIVPVAFHWPDRTIVFGPPRMPTDDMAADLDALAAFYAFARGRHGEPVPPAR
jgi:1-acyl-sn-glycerol-3-phosphate acyltransferase